MKSERKEVNAYGGDKITILPCSDGEAKKERENETY